MPSSDRPHHPSPSVEDDEIYFNFTTESGSLVLFENGTLSIITSCGGEVHLDHSELLQIFATIKGDTRLGQVFHRFVG